MSKRMVVHDSVYAMAEELAENRDITMKEALRDMCKDGGYDV